MSDELKAGRYTHTQLVNVARKWLAKRSPVVVTEMSSYGLEEADALGFRADGHTTLVECKATRADFRSDAKKLFRLHPEQGMGAERYYLTGPALVRADELPAGWGLLEWDGRRVRTLRESGYFAERSAGRECGLLVSVVRRFGWPARHGVSVRCYEINSERRARATLGIMRDTLATEARHEPETELLMPSDAPPTLFAETTP